jgi:hypothetical protein
MKHNEQQIEVRNQKPQQQQETQMSNQQQNGAAIDPTKLTISEIVTARQLDPDGVLLRSLVRHTGEHGTELTPEQLKRQTLPEGTPAWAKTTELKDGTFVLYRTAADEAEAAIFGGSPKYGYTVRHRTAPAQPQKPTVIQNQQPDDREAEFEEGEFYRGFVQYVTFEMSMKEPGWRYPRVKCLVFDRNGAAKPMSWIPFTRQEEASGITAIDPNARNQAPSALVGKEFCAKVTLRRGVTISRLYPVTFLSTPTLAQQGLLETRDTDFCDPAPKAA